MGIGYIALKWRLDQFKQIFLAMDVVHGFSLSNEVTAGPDASKQR